MASRLRRWGLVGLLALLVAPSGGFAASRIASRYLIVPNHSIAGIVIGEAAGPVVDTI